MSSGENHNHEGMKRFLYQYIRSMRLYYGFVTGTTVLFGIWMAHADGSAWGWREAMALIVGFLAWGVNQIFSDYCDRKEDAVNAPHRPMVSGELEAAGLEEYQHDSYR